MGQIMINLVGGRFFFRFIYQDLAYNLFYKIIFLIDNVLFITAVNDISKI